MSGIGDVILDHDIINLHHQDDHVIDAGDHDDGGDADRSISFRATGRYTSRNLPEFVATDRSLRPTEVFASAIRNSQPDNQQLL